MNDLYYPADSWLHRADPRAKLALVLLGVALLFAINHVVVLLTLLALVLALLRSAGVPWARLRAVWVLVLPVAVLIPLLWPLFYRAGPEVARVWRVSVTAYALAQGLATAARIVALAFLSSLILFTTEMRALLRALVRLGAPYEVALTVTIGLSFIPRIRRTYEQVTEAQLARGLVLSAGGFLGRAQARVPILVAALVSTFRGADTLSRALECRGFGFQGVRRTSLFELHWRPADTALALGSAVVVGALLALRFAYGLGGHPLLPR